MLAEITEAFQLLLIYPETPTDTTDPRDILIIITGLETATRGNKITQINLKQ